MEREQKESLMTPEEVCDYLRIRKQTLYNMITKRKIPHIKMPISSCIRFELEDINNWLKKGKEVKALVNHSRKRLKCWASIGYFREMGRITKFTLERYGVKANFKIIPLTRDEWKELARGMVFIDKWDLRDVLRELLEDNNCGIEKKQLKRWIKEGNKYKKEAQREYGRFHTLKEYLNCMAAMLKTPLICPKKITKSTKKLLFLVEESKDKDFLVVLNTRIISRYSREEKLKTAVHETLHFIESLKNTGIDFKSIEKKTDRIYRLLEKKARTDLASYNLECVY